MTLDEQIHKEMKDDLPLTSRIAMYIPIYRGYREKNLRRDEDRAIRTELSRAIQGTKQDLAEIQRGLVSQPPLMMDVERIRTKVDKYDIDVKKAVNGYSAFHASVKILEDDLDKLVKWDAQLIDDIQLLRTVTDVLLHELDSGEDVKQELRDLERGVDDMIEAYNQREAVMRSFAQE